VKSAVVIGGGAVGLCVAETMASRGAAVTAIERGRCGMGASAGNAGWITPSLAIPVPGPGVIGQSLRWLVDPSGPLWIRPTLAPAMLAWISRFMLSCPRRVYRRGLLALQGAAARAAESFDRLAEREVEFELHTDELLYPAFSGAELEHLLRVAAELREAGSRLPIERLGGPEMMALESALSDRVVGGLLAGGERRVRPESLTAGLTRRLRSLGAAVIEGAAVTELTRTGPSEWLVASGSRQWTAGRVVLSNGVGAARLLGRLGVHLPLAAAKGYSRTFTPTPTGPARPMYLETPKVSVSVFDGGVRVSGTLELGARTLTLSDRRLCAIQAAAEDAMPGWNPPRGSVDWAGMRSLSPDGLPYIGAVPGQPGIFVAAGHATLGITLAPLTAELLGDLILEERTDPLLAAFDPARAVARRRSRRQPGGPR
jgi:D-amino-acid dehydrogenase